MPLQNFAERGHGFARKIVHEAPLTIDASAVDAGNTGQTHILRAGLALGKITASSKLAQYNNGASDGTQTCVGYLLQDVDLKDGNPLGSAADHTGNVLLIGIVKTGLVYGSDAGALVDLGFNIVHTTN